MLPLDVRHNVDLTAITRNRQEFVCLCKRLVSLANTRTYTAVRAGLLAIMRELLWKVAALNLKVALNHYAKMIYNDGE